MKAGAYSMFETAIKAAPIVIAFTSAAYYRPKEMVLTADVEK